MLSYLWNLFDFAKSITVKRHENIINIISVEYELKLKRADYKLKYIQSQNKLDIERLENIIKLTEEKHKVEIANKDRDIEYRDLLIKKLRGESESVQS